MWSFPNKDDKIFKKSETEENAVDINEKTR